MTIDKNKTEYSLSNLGYIYRQIFYMFQMFTNDLSDLQLHAVDLLVVV